MPLRVPAGKAFTVDFVLQNSGDVDWPDDLEFKCTSGIFEGVFEGVTSARPGDAVVINIPL
jgi:hypothetical protein